MTITLKKRSPIDNKKDGVLIIFARSEFNQPSTRGMK